MDDELYDEFGNYIGPDVDSDDGRDAPDNDVDDRPDTPLVRHSPVLNRNPSHDMQSARADDERPQNQLARPEDIAASQAIVLHEVLSRFHATCALFTLHRTKNTIPPPRKCTVRASRRSCRRRTRSR